MKATQAGIVIGVALEDAKEGTEMIKLRVLIQFVKQ